MFVLSFFRECANVCVGEASFYKRVFKRCAYPYEKIDYQQRIFQQLVNNVCWFAGLEAVPSTPEAV